MRNLLCLAILAACHATPATTTSIANQPSAPAKLGPTIARAELDARLADHRLQRLTDIEQLPDGGGNVGVVSEEPAVMVAGDVVSTLNCRPGGLSHQIVTDRHYFYVYAVQEPALVAPPGPHGEVMATPSTYCSYQRYRVTKGLAYGGELKIEEPKR